MANIKYSCKNIDKYAGNPHAIFARSRWELYYMQMLDNSSIVSKWISEPKYLNIRYLDPTAGIDIRTGKRIPRKNGTSVYWPDFIVQYSDGSIDIIEIKPQKESQASFAGNTYDKLALIKNMAKWQAADRFAKSIGARFRVLTEAQLFGKSRPTKSSKGTRTTVKTKGTKRGTKLGLHK